MYSDLMAFSQATLISMKGILYVKLGINKKYIIQRKDVQSLTKYLTTDKKF